jgi:uncharacterized protein YbjQ (UPF0145 family)
MQPNSLDSVASERLSHAEKIFTSDLSINEFALLHGAGFEPIELVMGVSVYHVGFQVSGIRQQQELGVLTEATYRARWNAMQRMQAEADSLKADGIVGVRLSWRNQGEAGEHLEFIAVGTAVRYTAKPGAFRRANGQAFSSHHGDTAALRLGTGRFCDGELRVPHRGAGVHANDEADGPQRGDATVDAGQLPSA